MRLSPHRKETEGIKQMRVLSQEEIDAMLANLLTNPSILPGSAEEKKEAEAKPGEMKSGA